MINKINTKIVYTIFFFSGISGLIYETVWLRVLSRILGCTVYATSIVLSAFMLGLALGSYFIGKHADKFKRIIRAYAILELFVAITAFLIYISLNNSSGVFKFIFYHINEDRLLYLFIQAVIVFFALVIPTFLMGGTLPILGTALKKHKGSFAKNIGNLYGLNTFGAVFGVLLSGFITIGSIGEFNTILIGVFINLLVSAVVLIFLDKKFIFESGGNIANTNTIENDTNNKISFYSDRTRKLVLIAYALIGFTSFALEIVWTRIFQLQLGTSIYSFSMVLGVYLLGSALGSFFAGKFYHKIKNPVQGLGYLIIFIGIYSIIGTYLFSLFMPYDSYEIFSLNRILIPLYVVFPFTFILGIIFPIISNCYVANKNRIGKDIGFLYSMNTIGCILGSLISGYILIRFVGTRGTIIIISLINGLMGMVIILSNQKKFFKKKNVIISSLILASIIILSYKSPDPFFTVVKKRVYGKKNMQLYYHKEGIMATTTAFGSTTDSLDKHILINGVGMTALVTEAKLMAHLPILLSPNNNTKEVLIICFGMGTCLKSAVTHNDVNCEVVELVKEEYETYNYFHKDGSEILANKRVKYYADDGRNFLLLNEKKYDIITIDPAPPIWSVGSVNLYSSDFFILCKEHLKQKGIFCLWVPPAPYTEVKMIMKSFYSIFPNTTVYRGIKHPGFYLIGTIIPLNIDTAKFKDAANNKAVMSDLNEWDNAFDSPEKMLDLKIADSMQLNAFLKNGKVITDNCPYTEFPLWRKRYNPLFKYEFNAEQLKKIINGELKIE
ncbi:MAG: fused MFS/spermidine synthase [Bacteroidales bacterium]